MSMTLVTLKFEMASYWCYAKTWKGKCKQYNDTVGNFMKNMTKALRNRNVMAVAHMICKDPELEQFFLIVMDEFKSDGFQAKEGLQTLWNKVRNHSQNKSNSSESETPASEKSNGELVGYAIKLLEEVCE